MPLTTIINHNYSTKLPARGKSYVNINWDASSLRYQWTGSPKIWKSFIRQRNQPSTTVLNNNIVLTTDYIFRYVQWGSSLDWEFALWTSNWRLLHPWTFTDKTKEEEINKHWRSNDSRTHTKCHPYDMSTYMWNSSCIYYLNGVETVHVFITCCPLHSLPSLFLGVHKNFTPKSQPEALCSRTKRW